MSPDLTKFGLSAASVALGSRPRPGYKNVLFTINLLDNSSQQNATGTIFSYF
jgi:hypothetical protein